MKNYYGYKASAEFRKEELKSLKAGVVSVEDGDAEQEAKFETEEEAKAWLSTKNTKIKYFSNAGMQFASVVEYYYNQEERDEDDCIVESSDWIETTDLQKVDEV